MGIGFLGILSIVFMILKLTAVITWSWWWVWAPLWVPGVPLAIIFMIAGAVWFYES